MSSTYEGDIIRPLGLVTLYSGYAELEIDDLLDSLSRIEKLDDKVFRWPVGQKIAKAKEIMDRLESDALSELAETLDEALVLFDRRNALVHGAIFSGTTTIKSRASGREQEVSADALTVLARKIFSVKEHICVKRQKTLEPVLDSLEKVDRKWINGCFWTKQPFTW